jgi:phosphatidylglycerophosphate synthase
MTEGQNLQTRETMNRRPLATRDKRWAQNAARLLTRTSITPNQISMLGIVFSAIGGALFLVASENPWVLLVAALSIQLRLICNLLDGMVAVEGHRGSSDGPLYNEVPDRIEDSLFIIGMGYAADLLWLGFVAALFAMSTAYIRVLGGSFGFAQDFRGPMAKQHRMAAMTIGCIAAFVESLFGATHYCLVLTLIVVAAGALVTAIRRTLAIASLLANKQP